MSKNDVGVKIARRYAKALFLIAEETDRIDLYSGQLGDIVAILEASPKARFVMCGRHFGTEKKKQLAGELFGERLEKDMMSFLYLVLDKGRGGFLESILSEYRALADEKNGLLSVSVVSASALGENQRTALSGRLESVTGKKIRISETSDESILGGFKLTVGDFIYDASVLGQLSAIEQHLVR